MVGEKKTQRKFVHREMRKKANMRREAMRISVRIAVTLEGSATVAPARSSERIIWTGLNHQRFCG